MSPRASLPGADELFRATSPRKDPETPDAPPAADVEEAFREPESAPTRTSANRPAGGRPTARRAAERSSTGRERHEEKITVYVSAAELVDLERARLALRAEHGIGVDRGRIVREALSVVLADLDAKQDESILVRRLREA